MIATFAAMFFGAFLSIVLFTIAQRIGPAAFPFYVGLVITAAIYFFWS